MLPFTENGRSPADETTGGGAPPRVPVKVWTLVPVAAVEAPELEAPLADEAWDTADFVALVAAFVALAVTDAHLQNIRVSIILWKCWRKGGGGVYKKCLKNEHCCANTSFLIT